MRTGPAGGAAMAALPGETPGQAAEAADRKLLRTGLIGTGVAMICCFTPALVLVLGAVGLSAVLGWIDFVLLPAMAGFAALSLYALRRRWRRRQARQDATTGWTGQ